MWMDISPVGRSGAWSFGVVVAFAFGIGIGIGLNRMWRCVPGQRGAGRSRKRRLDGAA